MKTDPLPDQNTEGAEIPDVLTRRQNLEEAALRDFKQRARKVIDRYAAELEQEDPDLSERRTMAGLVLAKIDSSSTEREVTSALKILQGTFGHTVQQHQVTHTHLTLEARLETGIATAKRMGFIQDEPQEAQVEIVHVHQARRDGEPSATDPSDLSEPEARGVRAGAEGAGDAEEVPGLGGVSVERRAEELNE